MLNFKVRRILLLQRWRCFFFHTSILPKCHLAISSSKRHFSIVAAGKSHQKCFVAIPKEICQGKTFYVTIQSCQLYLVFFLKCCPKNLTNNEFSPFYFLNSTFSFQGLDKNKIDSDTVWQPQNAKLLIDWIQRSAYVFGKNGKSWQHILQTMNWW